MTGAAVMMVTVELSASILSMYKEKRPDFREKMSLTLPQDITVGGLLDDLGIDPRLISILIINDERCLMLNEPLPDGAEVKILGPLAGG